MKRDEDNPDVGMERIVFRPFTILLLAFRRVTAAEAVCSDGGDKFEMDAEYEAAVDDNGEVEGVDDEDEVDDADDDDEATARREILAISTGTFSGSEEKETNF